MRDLPDPIVAKAYKSPGSGELAWRLTDVPEAAAAIAESSLAVLGGEVWLVDPAGRGWTGLIPSRDKRPPSVWTWDVSPRELGESWQAYCTRAAHETIATVSRLPIEAESSEDVVDDLWIHLLYVSKDEE